MQSVWMESPRPSVSACVECVCLPIGFPDCLFVNAMMTFWRGGGGGWVVLLFKYFTSLAIVVKFLPVKNRVNGKIITIR